MNKETEELLISLNKKLDYIDELKEVMNGDKGNNGLIADVHTIKKELIGDPDFKKEGLIAIVQRHDEFFKKMQNMSTMSIWLMSAGAAVASAFYWIIDNFHHIKKIFS
jgi:hypothetical protein